MSKRTWYGCAAVCFFVSAGCGLLGAQQSATPEAAQATGDAIGTAVGIATGNPLAAYAVGAIVTTGLGIFSAFKAAKAKPATA